MKKEVLLFAVIIGIGALFAYYAYTKHAVVPAPSPEGANSAVPVAQALYVCDEGHVIAAEYLQGTPRASHEGEPPIPSGSVVLRLDDEAPISLFQTLSASGVRFSDGDPQIKAGQQGAESLVFWNKGNTALILRNNEMDLTYTNCAAQ